MSQGIRPDYLLCSSSPRTIHSLETLISQIMYGDDNVPETHTCGTELYNAYDADMMIDVDQPCSRRFFMPFGCRA